MPTLLIVDDEQNIRMLIKKYAVFDGYEAQEAEDGMEAVEKVRNGHFDLIIMDVMMPEPLPAGHSLWDCPRLIITPHVSGNASLGLTCDINVDMFCADLARYAAGKPLGNLVDRGRGY